MRLVGRRDQLLNRLVRTLRERPDANVAVSVNAGRRGRVTRSVQRVRVSTRDIEIKEEQDGRRA